jgi:hypothetical protein
MYNIVAQRKLPTIQPKVYTNVKGAIARKPITTNLTSIYASPI